MRSTPPFRAEHVGSLLRPANLLQARAAAEGDQYRQVTGPLDFSELKALEDEAIVDAVRLQESVGLQVVTDGEFRRRSWFQDFLLALEYEIVAFWDQFNSDQKRIRFEEMLLLTGLLGAGIFAFVLRRMHEERRDIEQRLRTELELRENRALAQQDPLTTLPNRRAIKAPSTPTSR